jgi:hypothetical protein
MLWVQLLVGGWDSERKCDGQGTYNFWRRAHWRSLNKLICNVSFTIFSGDTYCCTWLTFLRCTGLSVVLAIRETEYIKVPAQTKTVGARVSITPFGILPNPESYGYNVVPGHSTDIILQQVISKTISMPFCQLLLSRSLYLYVTMSFLNETERFV